MTINQLGYTYIILKFNSR